MRLNPFNTDNIRVQSSGSRFPGGGGGKVGCGGIVLALVGYLLFGLDPSQTLGVVEGVQQQGGSTQVAANSNEQEVCTANRYATETCNALQSLNQTWEPVFAQANVPFRDPQLTFIEGGSVNTGCGAATSAVGPFYCPADEGIYIDTRFYETLDQELGAGGDFARYYVIAHEYGHHIQNVTGISDQIRSVQSQNPQRGNQLSVLLELQADCYAGVWAGKNRNQIEPGDIEEGLRAASAIGDDTLQRRSGRGVNPESFTHGTSEQRMQALRLGLRGDDRACDQITALR